MGWPVAYDIEVGICRRSRKRFLFAELSAKLYEVNVVSG